MNPDPKHWILLSDPEPEFWIPISFLTAKSLHLVHSESGCRIKYRVRNPTRGGGTLLTGGGRGGRGVDGGGERGRLLTGSDGSPPG
jgi:hypothetical protein